MKSLEEKIPQVRKSQSRDEAGKAAGINGRYVDMATISTQRGFRKKFLKAKPGGKSSIEEKIPQSRKSRDSRDERMEAGRPKEGREKIPQVKKAQAKERQGTRTDLGNIPEKIPEGCPVDSAPVFRPTGRRKKLRHLKKPNASRSLR